MLVKARGKLEPSVIAAGQMFFGMIPCFCWDTSRQLSVSLDTDVSRGDVLSGDRRPVLAFFLSTAIHNMDVTKSMLIALVTGRWAVVLGMIVLREQLNWRTIAGGANDHAWDRIYRCREDAKNRTGIAYGSLVVFGIEVLELRS